MYRWYSTSIKLLIETRDKVDVYSDIPYIFAVNDGCSTNHIRGYDALKKVIANVELNAPEQLTSTKVRKYVATVSQILDMNNSENGWLAS